MNEQELKMNCLHLASNLLGANNHAALASGETTKPTPEAITKAAQKLYDWVKG